MRRRFKLMKISLDVSAILNHRPMLLRTAWNPNYLSRCRTSRLAALARLR